MYNYIFTLYTLFTTYIHLCTPYIQPTYSCIQLIYNLYSYFEKGRKKCTRQSHRALWVVLSALFFKEIGKKGTGGHGQVFTSAKGKQQRWVRHLYTPCIQLIFTLYATYIHLIFNLYTLYSQPIFTIYTLFTTYIHLCKPYSQPIYTLYTTYIRHMLTIFNNYPSSPNGL